MCAGVRAGLLAGIAVLALGAPVRAQEASAPAPSADAEDTVGPSAGSAGAGFDAAASLGASDAERLAALRRGHRDARRDEGLVLLSYGLASIALGAVAAGVGHQDERWLGFGLGTLGWGAIDALLSLLLLDLGGGQLRALDADRALRGVALDHAREDWAAGQYRSGAVLAANAGLDVFYVVTGALLFVIGARSSPELGWLEGYGIAMASQGTGLLAYDVITWIAATQRGDQARSLFR